MRSGDRPRHEQLERSGALRDAVVRRVLDELLERRGRGELRAADVRAAATTAAVSERTLWRWLAAGAPTSATPA